MAGWRLRQPREAGWHARLSGVPRRRLSRLVVTVRGPDARVAPLARRSSRRGGVRQPWNARWRAAAGLVPSGIRVARVVPSDLLARRRERLPARERPLAALVPFGGRVGVVCPAGRRFVSRWVWIWVWAYQSLRRDRNRRGLRNDHFVPAGALDAVPHRRALVVLGLAGTLVSAPGATGRGVRRSRGVPDRGGAGGRPEPGATGDRRRHGVRRGGDRRARHRKTRYRGRRNRGPGERNPRDGGATGDRESGQRITVAKRRGAGDLRESGPGIRVTAPQVQCPHIGRIWRH